MQQFRIVCKLDIAFLHFSPQPLFLFRKALPRFVVVTVYLLSWSQSGLVVSRKYTTISDADFEVVYFRK